MQTEGIQADTCEGTYPKILRNNVFLSVKPKENSTTGICAALLSVGLIQMHSCYSKKKLCTQTI